MKSAAKRDWRAGAPAGTRAVGDRAGAAPRAVRIGLPKGHMQGAVFALLAQAGIEVRVGSRNYRPALSWPGFEAKLLKPQNVVRMLHAGSRDVGFAGADWVAELDADVAELLDTGLDPVRVVAAAPEGLLRREAPAGPPGGGATAGLPGGGSPDGVAEDGPQERPGEGPGAPAPSSVRSLAAAPGRPLVVASEYVRLARRWARAMPFQAEVVRSYGATEVFPPEDADLIVDNTASGATLSGNGLVVADTLMRSSTRLYGHPAALDDPVRRARIDDLVTLLRSVLEARRRVMLELNVAEADLERVIAILPCMREPTVSRLHADGGYAIRAAVPREVLPALLLDLKARGGTDLVVSRPQQIVP